MTAEQINDIVQWDVKSWSRALFMWSSELELSAEMWALELGGRQGGLSLWLALKSVHVVCSDLTDVRDTASVLHEKHDVIHLVEYRGYRRLKYSIREPL